MPQTYRCSQCGTDWPAAPGYSQCPHCRVKTSSLWDGSPLSAKDAQLRVFHLTFAKHYEESRGVPVDSESDPAGDPNREAIGMWCDHPEADGFLCWACDPIPRRPDANTDFEAGLLNGS